MLVLNPPILYSHKSCHLSLCVICSCHGDAHVISYQTNYLMVRQLGWEHKKILWFSFTACLECDSFWKQLNR